MLGLWAELTLCRECFCLKNALLPCQTWIKAFFFRSLRVRVMSSRLLNIQIANNFLLINFKETIWFWRRKIQFAGSFKMPLCLKIQSSIYNKITRAKRATNIFRRKILQGASKVTFNCYVLLYYTELDRNFWRTL